MAPLKGETHAYLFTTRGVKRANYCGPGTQLEMRLARGDKPVSNLDAICRTHDIAYSRARTPQDTRNADLAMLASMDKDPWIPIHEKLMIGSLMRGKIAGEKIGVFGPERFTKLPNLEKAPPKKKENQSAKAKLRRSNLQLYLSEPRLRRLPSSARRRTKKAKTKRKRFFR